MCVADLGHHANKLTIKVADDISSNKFYYAPVELVKVTLNSTCQKIVTFNFTGTSSDNDYIVRNVDKCDIYLLNVQ